MFHRAQPVAIALVLLLSPCAAYAQIVWQPTPPPQVTAENTSWYLSGEPIDWNGQLYYPAGPKQFFNRYQMVRSGSFRGIPLYTDTMHESNSVVYVPLPGERMQPYERAPLAALQVTVPEGVKQSPAAPARAPAYDVSTPAGLAMPRPNDIYPRATSEPMAVGTSGRTIVTPAPHRATTLRRPTGVNAIWIDFDGRRWVSAGKTIDYDAASLTEVGKYHGWSVYTRNGDPSTIYIPSMPGKLAPYKTR